MHQNIALLLTFMWCKRNNLFQPISYAFCCQLYISLTMLNLSFCGRFEMSTGLKFQWKIQNHKAMSNCCQMGGKAQSSPNFWTANIEPLSKNCHNRVEQIIYSTKLLIPDILPNFFTLELFTMVCLDASCYHVAIQCYTAFSHLAEWGVTQSHCQVIIPWCR